MENQAILLADYRQEVVEGGSLVIKMGEAFDYKPGDVITGVMEKKTGEKQELSIAVALQTTEHPMCINYAQRGILIVSDRLISRYEDFLGPETDVYIRCEDPEALEREAENCIGVPDYSVYNVAEEYRRSQALYTMLGIFLYGFITVIALIGVTNIFNTITTNMELRSREFAMLRSVGMTGGEFRRMIRLENLFYGAKALAAGIPIGWVLYALFYRILDLRVETGFVLPWKSTLLAAAAVVLLLAGIMRYSIAKIGRQDIVETIQNENR